VNFELPESQLHAWISAFNTKPKSLEELFRSAVEKYPDVSIQLVDLDKVPGQRYLKLAAVNASKSFHSKQPIAKTLAMELLLYISAEKQIVKALKQVGVTPETNRTAAVAVGNSRDRVREVASFLSTALGQASQDELLDDWQRQRTKSVRTAFDIGEKELKAILRNNETEWMAIERLAVERSAMLAAKK
jgi:tRNA threonylcarbamoyladenosine modification (KEOPS) complex Cgi121 subunit